MWLQALSMHSAINSMLSNNKHEQPTSGLLKPPAYLIFFLPKSVILRCRGWNQISSNTIQTFITTIAQDGKEGGIVIMKDHIYTHN